MRPYAGVPQIRKWMAIGLMVPGVSAPLIAVLLNLGDLPVLVADYLALHLFICGALQLTLF